MTSPSLEMAIEYLQRSEDWAKAEERLVDRSPDMFARGKSTVVRSLARSFPEAWRSGSAPLQQLLGECERLAGDMNASLRCLVAAERLAGPDRALKGRIWASRAAVHGFKGDLAPMYDFADAALEALPPTAFREIGIARNTLGMYHVFRQEPAKAQEHFAGALRAYLDCGDVSGQAGCHHNIGLSLARRGEFEQALTRFREAIRLPEANGLRPHLVTFGSLADCLLRLARTEEARQALTSGMSLAGQEVADRHPAALKRAFGRIRLATGRLTEAKEAFEAARDISARQGDRLSLRYAHLALADLALREGNPDQAELALDQAMAVSGLKEGEPGSEEMALAMSEMALAFGRRELAQRLLAPLAAKVGTMAGAPLAFHESGLRPKLTTALGDVRFAPREEEGGPPGFRSASPALVVKAFGVFEAAVEGRAIEPRDWRLAKAKLALAYLLLHPEGVSKEALAELLFPYGDTDRTAVNVVISRLRSALDPEAPRSAPSRFVHYRGGGIYTFNPALPVQVDAVEFRRLVAAGLGKGKRDNGRRGLLERAVALYRGPFMPEFSDSPWCQIERESARRDIGDAYESLIGLSSEADDWRAVERFALNWLGHDAIALAAHRARILGLAMQDRRDEALRAGSFALDNLAREDLLDSCGDIPDLLGRIRDDRLTMRDVRAALADS